MENSYLSGLMGHPQPRHGAADPIDPAAHLRSGLSSSPWALSAQMTAAAAAGIPGYDLHRSLQSAPPSGSHNPYLPPPPPAGTPGPLHPHEDPATVSLIAAQRHSYLAAAAAAESQKRIAAEMHHHALSAAALREAAARREEHLTPGPAMPRENMFSHGFPPLDRGGLYPSHGGILDPLSQSLPPPSPHHNPLHSSAFLSSHHPRAVAGSSHVSPTPSISKPSELSSKDRSIHTSMREETRAERLHDVSKTLTKPAFGPSSDHLRSQSSDQFKHLDGSFPPHIPSGKSEIDESHSSRPSALLSANQTNTATTRSCQTLSTNYKSHNNQKQTSIVSVSTSTTISISASTQDHASNRSASINLGLSSSLVKSSNSFGSDEIKLDTSENTNRKQEGILRYEENAVTPFHPHHIQSLSHKDANNANPKNYSASTEEDEVEELLVDDFDGQCSRTYPDNHSRIVRWRASKNERGKLLGDEEKDNIEANSNSSNASSLSRSKEITSDIRCKDWAKSDNDNRKPLQNSNTNGFDTSKNLSNQPSILSDHERNDFAAKKRRLMTSASLDHSKPSSTLTTESNSTGSIIPVGIAIGRQRQQQDPKSTSIGEKRKIDGQGANAMLPHISPSGGMGASSLDSIAGGSSSALKSMESRMISSPHSTQTAHHAAHVAAQAAAQRWPSPYPSLGSGLPYPSMPPSPWRLPGAGGSAHSYKPYGPIPMGYQLATDPLTGQILLIPTDSGVPPSSSMWPPHLPGTAPAPPHAGASPYPPNPLLSTPHHHHAAAAAAAHAHAASLQQHQQHSLYLQHQQYQQQLQQQHQRRSGGVPSQSLPNGKSRLGGLSGEPETITLSDDDDVQNPKHNRSTTEKNSDQANRDNIDSRNETSEVEKNDQSVNPNESNAIDSKIDLDIMPSDHTTSRVSDSNVISNTTSKASNKEDSYKSSEEESVVDRIVKDQKSTPAKIKTERISDFGVSLNESNAYSEISSQDCALSVFAGTEEKHQLRGNGTIDAYSIQSTNKSVTDKVDQTYNTEDIKREPEGLLSSTYLGDHIKLEKDASNELSHFEEEESNPNIICARTLLQLAESEYQNNSIFSSCDFENQSVLCSEGLDILLAGIEIRTFEEMELLKNSNFGVDMLCSITRQDCYHIGISDSCYQITLEDLCEVTKDDYYNFLYWVDPIVLLKHQYRIREYRSEARAMMCRNFITDKIAAKKEESLLTLDENFQCPNAKIKSLDQVIRKIKNTEIMSQLEVSLREQIFQLQDIYSEKQKEVTRLKLTPKKVKKLRTKRQRGPGRPKKRILKSTKSKMGRPRKTRESCDSMVDKETEIEQLSDNGNDGDIDIIKMPVEDQNLPPPILEPFKNNSLKLKNSRKSTDSPPPPPLTPMMETSGDGAATKSTSSTNSHLTSNLLRPPKLTANSSSPVPPKNSSKVVFSKNKSSVTNLSTINEKFMKGKANPFANLLTKLATKPSNAQNGSEDKEDEVESSPSEIEEDDKEKESQTDDGDESEKKDQEIESTTSEEEEEPIKLERNQNRSLLRMKESEDNEEDEKLSVSRKSSTITDKKIQHHAEKTISSKCVPKKAAGKQRLPFQDPNLDITTELSSEQNVSSDFEDSYSNSAQKKRKSDKPKKHFGNTNEVETIVPKKPKNLFMMNCLKIQQNQRNEMQQPDHSCKKSFIKKDEYDFTDEEDDDHEIIKIGKRRKVDAMPEAANASSLSPPTLPMETISIPQTGSSTPSRVNPSISTSSSFTNRKEVSHRPSPTKEKTITHKHLARPRSAASISSFGSTKNFDPSSDESSIAGSPMKAPKGQIGSKKIAKEKKKPISGSSSTDKNTHICPEPSRTATLQESDLKDGLKMLTLQDGRFWPARLNSTPLPDIFGVVVEGQRGNRPNIMARDDILNQAILDLKPHCRKQLPVGTRVCIYWSNATGNCMFPGTIDTLDGLWPETSGMVQVILDDGDERQVDMSKVRLLPPNYQHVEYDPDPISSLRRRRISADSADSGSGDHHSKRKDNIAPLSTISETSASPSLAATCSSPVSNGKRNHQNTKNGSCLSTTKDVSNKLHMKKKKHHHCKHKHKKLNGRQKSENNQTPGEEAEDEDSDDDDDSEDETDQNLRIKLDGSFNNTTTYSIRSPIYPAGTRTCSEGGSNHEDEKERDGDDEFDGDSEENEDDASDVSDEEETPKKSPRKYISKLKLDSARKKGINPVTGRPLWRWVDGDDGYRRPGSKGKAKKLFHRDIQRGGNSNEILSVGDCAVFLSTARVDRPYIGKVELLWETWNGNMMVKVKWFYHPEEIETTGKKFDLKLPGGLFQSPHTDENDVQTISHKCSVLPMKEYSRMIMNDSAKRRKIQSSGDSYYLAGSYDPTSCAVSFQTGVIKQ